MGYSTLSLDKNVLEKVNKLYTEMNKGGVFRSKSTFIELIIDFFWGPSGPGGYQHADP